MIAQDIITPVARTLFDQGNVRWGVAELLGWITEAQLEIVRKMPDANSVTAIHALVAGSKQTIPADGIRLLRVLRNVGAEGDTPAGAIMPTSRATMDAMDPLWHTRTGAQVEHYIYDPTVDRKTWWAFPGLAQGDGNQVELIYSQAPAIVNQANQELDLSDHYRAPITDWVMYRAWTKDAEHGGNLGMAQHYFAAFYQDLGIEFQFRSAVDPNARVRGGGSGGPV